MIRLLFLLGTIFGGSVVASAEPFTIHFEHKAGGALSIVASGDGELFSPDAIQASVVPYLKQRLAGTTFVSLALFHDAAEVNTFAQGRECRCRSVSEWRNAVLAATPPKEDAALFFASASGIAVRLRSSGLYSRQVLEGEDPSAIRFPEFQADILLVLCFPDIPLFRSNPHRRQRVDVWIRVNRIITDEEASALARRLSGLMSIEHMLIYIRPDLFFPGSELFPLVYPFAPFPERRELDAYRDVKTGCYLTESGLTCYPTEWEDDIYRPTPATESRGGRNR